jgi:hypothetical protein
MRLLNKKGADSFSVWSVFFCLLCRSKQTDKTLHRKTRLPLGRSAQRNARTFLNQAQTKTQSKAQAIVRDPIYQQQTRGPTAPYRPSIQAQTKNTSPSATLMSAFNWSLPNLFIVYKIIRDPIYQTQAIVHYPISHHTIF